MGAVGPSTGDDLEPEPPMFLRGGRAVRRRHFLCDNRRRVTTWGGTSSAARVGRRRRGVPTLEICAPSTCTEVSSVLAAVLAGDRIRAPRARGAPTRRTAVPSTFSFCPWRAGGGVTGVVVARMSPTAAHPGHPGQMEDRLEEVRRWHTWELDVGPSNPGPCSGVPSSTGSTASTRSTSTAPWSPMSASSMSTTAVVLMAMDESVASGRPSRPAIAIVRTRRRGPHHACARQRVA